jgi:hypothetical protein
MNAASQTAGKSSAGESVQSVIDLTRRALDTQVRLTEEYFRVARSAFSQDADTAAAGRAFLDSVQREGENYLSRVADLGVTFGTSVLELGDKVSHSVLGDVSKALSPQQPAKPRASKSTTPRASKSTTPRAKKSTTRRPKKSST